MTPPDGNTVQFAGAAASASAIYAAVSTAASAIRAAVSTPATAKAR